MPFRIPRSRSSYARRTILSRVIYQISGDTSQRGLGSPRLPRCRSPRRQVRHGESVLWRTAAGRPVRLWRESSRIRAYGRGGGVGRFLGVGPILGVGVTLGVPVAVGVGEGEAVGVALGIT